jgi:hypothetical protein
LNEEAYKKPEVDKWILWGILANGLKQVTVAKANH